ncbi:MAG: hypothetical protein IIZ83_08395 [Oscillospiraceae bacterium]|nr:hypothetical protein [Oscillospiraceae bacterium]
MVTKNFKNLLGMMLQSAAATVGVLPVADVTGRIWYSPANFAFPGSRTAAVTTNATAAGISVGTGSTAATENDVNLENTITSGVSLSLTTPTLGQENGEPYVEYVVTITNTSGAELTVSEIGYKQTLKGTPKPGGASASDVVCLIDRTVLDEAITLAANQAGTIVYRLKTKPQEDKTVSGVKIVSFTYGSDADVAAMIDAAQQGTIDLQADGGWRVGDMRVIHLDAWTGGNSVAHAAEDIAIAISSFADYNSCGCVMQFDFVDCCTGNQRMNSSNTTTGGYGATEMFTTTLPALVLALPSWLQTRLKTFDVLASKGGSDLATIETVSGNKLALRSEIEVFGVTTYSKPGEGSQIDWYKIAAVRVKTSGFSGSATTWWERSAGSSSGFCTVNNNGSANSNSASYANGVAPFGCI